MRIEFPDGLVYAAEGRYAVSTFPDGARLVADTWPQSSEQHLRADALGYGVTTDAVVEMNRDHDLAHHVVARALGYPACPLLQAQAAGHQFQGITLDTRDIEALALLVQRAVNVRQLVDLA